MFAVLFRIASGLRRDRKAVTALEYGLIACLVAIAITAGLHTFGSDLSTKFSNIGTALSGVSTTISH